MGSADFDTKSFRACFVGRNGVFTRLPRDGAINPLTFEVFQEVPLGLNLLGDRGYYIAIVENEKGHLPGYDYPKILALIERTIRGLLAYPTGFRYCIHPIAMKCDCRMPKTGLFQWFADEVGIDLKASAMIAAKSYHVQAAEAAGITNIVRVPTGNNRWAKETESYPLADNCLEAAQLILGNE